ncbi:putative aminoacrylate hydrolase RutD [Methanocorpusculaceae archaeon Sp1]|uniref:Aminoacrylate hydrolase RutD n=1 Tax=Methanorbis furvi TaxID=3028299 RepID=A0AAE4MEI2_9EURY|nr:putative aminoacrylate hydrolase RutD [Methanocorpusculaceae archaeon Sp1]MDV0442482.1 putative aminoacrylate hydrolase RutD [Methanocorpusculaceae archaeon Ag1]
MLDEIRYAASKDTKVAYRIVGSGSPLVIVSGLGDSMNDWKESIVQALAKEYCVILPDNRGMGLTRIGSVAPQKMTISQYAEDVFAVVQKEGLTDVYLLGHSMGGMIAQEFALSHPDRVKKLMLFATDYGPESSYRARLMNRCVLPLQALSVIAPWHTKGFRAGACAIASWEGTAERLCTIQCETMLLFGDTDFLMHIDVGHEMHAMIDASVLKIVPGGTHRMHDLYPREFTKTVQTFFGETAEQKKE